MSSEVDFETMTGDQIMAWLRSNDDQSSFVRWMMQTGYRPTEAESDQPATRLIAVRIPVELVERLDELTAGSKEGRSGLIRLSVQELLKKIDESHAHAA